MTVLDSLLFRLLLRDEGYRRYAYRDSLNYLTIGIGRLIDERKGGGLSLVESTYLLENDIVERERILDATIPWWRSLNKARQAAIISMAYQLGPSGLLSFGNTLRYMKDGAYEQAALNMLCSKWAQQTPLRAHRLSEVIRTGDPASLQLDEDPPSSLE